MLAITKDLLTVLTKFQPFIITFSGLNMLAFPCPKDLEGLVMVKDILNVYIK